MEKYTTSEKNAFPWEIGVFDAHCHPTDTMTSVSDIPHMRATALTVMSTRGEDQDLVDEIAKKLGDYHYEADSDATTTKGKIIPCFGWHPWFAHRISIQEDQPDVAAPSTMTKKTRHYRDVLAGSMENEDEAFFNSLPDPKPLPVLLAETKKRLLAHPNALIGEVGLDKAFRLPMPWHEHETESRDAGLTPGSREGRKLSPYKVTIAHQKALLKAQLQLAGQLRRAVSVHSVQAHGAVFDVLQELWKGHERKSESKRQRKQRLRKAKNVPLAGETGHQEDGEGEDEGESDEDSLPYPPRICMHSYSGPAEALKQYLRPSVPSDVYFSFSAVINFANPSADKVVTAIQSLPDDRILVESDLHRAGEQMDDLLEEVVRTICQLKDWSLEDGMKILAANWIRFIFG